MRLSYAVINPKLVSQSSILAHPPHIRWAWLSLIIEGQIHDGVLPGLTAFQLSRLATISIQQAEEALRAFLSPDPFSACAANDGRRLELVDANTNTYRLVSFEFQQGLIRKARDAARKRATYAETVGEKAETAETERESPQIPPPLPTPTPLPQEKQVKDSAVPAASPSPRKRKAKRPPPDSLCPEMFATLWHSTIRKERREDAVRAFDAAVESLGESEATSRFATQIDAYNAKVRRERIAPKFIKQGGTLFNAILNGDTFGVERQPEGDHSF